MLVRWFNNIWKPSLPTCIPHLKWRAAYIWKMLVVSKTNDLTSMPAFHALTDQVSWGEFSRVWTLLIPRRELKFLTPHLFFLQTHRPKLHRHGGCGEILATWGCNRAKHLQAVRGSVPCSKAPQQCLRVADQTSFSLVNAWFELAILQFPSHAPTKWATDDQKLSFVVLHTISSVTFWVHHHEYMCYINLYYFVNITPLSAVFFALPVNAAVQYNTSAFK